MRFSLFTGLLAALVVSVEAKPVSTGPQRRAWHHVLHERRPVMGHSWMRTSKVHHSAVLPVRIGLTQQNLDRGEEFLNDVAHPESAHYGQHWTPEQVADMFAPTQEAIDAVMGWLEDDGVLSDRIRLSPGRNWVMFNASVGEMERLLKTEYHVYKPTGHDGQQQQQHVACEEYHVPEHLQEHIDLVMPTVHFDAQLGTQRTTKTVPVSDEDQTAWKRGHTPGGSEALQSEQRQRPAKGIVGSPTDASLPKQGVTITNALMGLAQCDSMITPACLRALYRTPAGALAAANNSIGIVEYTPQAILAGDLDLYFSQFERALVGARPVLRLVDNAVLQTQNQSFSFNGESALDLEFAMALVYPQTATLFQVGDLVQGASFNNLLDALDGSYCAFQGGGSTDPGVDGQYSSDVACGTARPTNVLSTSYSYNEGDLTAAYEQRQCSEYMKLGLQGVSVLYSSGDFGVAGNGGQCIDARSGAYNNGSSGLFSPSFPGSCPFVTSVGATELRSGTSVLGGRESACETVIFSGGGFSNVFALPSYQQSAMAGYFGSSPPPYGADRFNNSQTARGYPDVSANGANYVTAVNGNFSLSYGTSASAPTFASVLNLINEQRLAAGKGPVGFVNPVLYANPQVLNDIVDGNNPGCGTDGFAAVEGWDPLTGLGTPNYPAMEALFMSLP